jgi:hypothetical protein
MPVTKLLVDVGDGQAEQLVEDASTTVSQRSHSIYKSLFVLCQHHQQALLKNWGRFLPASIRKAHFFEARELFRMARQGLRCALQIGMPFQAPDLYLCEGGLLQNSTRPCGVYVPACEAERCKTILRPWKAPP